MAIGIHNLDVSVLTLTLAPTLTLTLTVTVIVTVILTLTVTVTVNLTVTVTATVTVTVTVTLIRFFERRIYSAVLRNVTVEGRDGIIHDGCRHGVRVRVLRVSYRPCCSWRRAMELYTTGAGNPQLGLGLEIGLELELGLG